MKVGMNGRGWAPVRVCIGMRVFPSSVQNIRNINNSEEKNQSEQQLTKQNAFRHWQNNTERSRTTLFLFVLEMFRFQSIRKKRCSPSATWLPEHSVKTVFFSVPVVPEQIGKAESHGLRGLQIFAKTLFRMFRTLRGGTRIWLKTVPAHA